MSDVRLPVTGGNCGPGEMDCRRGRSSSVNRRLPLGDQVIASVIIQFLLGSGLLLHLPGINVGVALADCGEQNAFYLPDEGLIVVCRELAPEAGGTVRFIVAHELGHAVVHQYGLPVIGSEEAMADEFAFLALIDSGHAGDLISVAAWFANNPREDVPHDDHSSPRRRAAVALCFAIGVLSESSECERRVIRAKQAWSRVLLAFGPAKVVSP